jgi:hypothetical protein
VIRRAARLACLTLVVWGAVPAAAAQDTIVYDDQLENGFVDWGWATRDYGYTGDHHGGTKSIRWEPDNWAGIQMHNDSSFDFSDYTELRLWLKSTGAQHAVDLIFESGGTEVHRLSLTSSITTAWSQKVVDFVALGWTSGSFNMLVMQDSSGTNQPALLVDDILLVASTAPPAPVTVAVDPALDRHPISRFIYGVNFASPAQIAANGYTVNRWGGNSTTRYNWQLDVHNSASDWFYFNYASSADPGQLPNGSDADHFVEDSRGAGALPLITVPTLGWVPGPDRVRRWGFSVATYGPQTLDECHYFGNDPDLWPDWCNVDAGNGLCTPGSGPHCSASGRITGNSISDTSIASDGVFIGGWIDHLVGRYGSGGTTGVPFYALDNEAMLWNSTHADVHPNAATYDEVWTKGRDIAHAVKQHDPTALVAGPVTWGWCDLFTSAADAPGDCTAGPDRDAHGGTPFVQWYLQQVCSDQAATGTRPVDYLDIHYYPQADGVAGTDNIPNEGVAPTRFRSLRELWDPTYLSESWIGAIPDLVPRLRAWIAAACPGVKIAITEYKWGADASPTGALAQAEALAIFARESVDLATRWVVPDGGTKTEEAFRLFRNYDGAGGKVTGDSVRATTTDVNAVGAYAVRGNDERLFVLLFNKDDDPRDTTVNVAAGLTGNVALWRFTDSSALAAAGTLPLAGGSFVAALPKRSATLAIVKLASNELFRDDFESAGLDAWAARVP